MKRIFSLSLVLIGLLIAVAGLAPRETTAAPSWQTYSPPGWILGPIQGADGKEATVLENLDMIKKWGVPITAFHFDAPDWMSCKGNAQFRYSDTVLNKMRARNIRGLFWIVPLIDLKCPEYQVALANNYFVRDDQNTVIVTENFTGHGSWLDFDNPDAVAWWHTLLDALLTRTGDVFGGFYTDNVRPDAGTSLPSYGETYALDLLNYVRSHIPDGEVIFKRYGKNTPSDEWLAANAHLAYVNDLPTTFNGMRVGIERVFATTGLMPLPYNEFSGFNKTPPDTTTYIRRMHWGAFQPVMENVPKGAQPWAPHYTPAVMEAFAYYATLHAELMPYLHSYDQAAFETQTPILRDTNTANFSARLGNEFWVQYITDYLSTVKITPPAGEWLNYWNESQIFKGGKSYQYTAPLGKEPILIARGAIIPMRVQNGVTGHGTKSSKGALTVNVYPIQHSTFQYYDETNGWVTFDVTTNKQSAALCSVGAATSEPLLWRMASVRQKPNTVTVQNGAVGVNTAWGTALPERGSELRVGQNNSGWYYDALNKRLIVKISDTGTDCPVP